MIITVHEEIPQFLIDIMAQNEPEQTINMHSYFKFSINLSPYDSTTTIHHRLKPACDVAQVFPGVRLFDYTWEGRS